MEKRKKWHLYLILSVIFLTIYHIFPTIFYYSKPLGAPVSKEVAEGVGERIAGRVGELKQDATEWVGAFCDLIRVKPVAVAYEEGVSRLIRVQFGKEEDARRFRQYFPKAGSSIPFAPAQMELSSGEDHEKVVFVRRRVPIDLQAGMLHFVEKGSEAYRKVMLDRAAFVGSALTGPSEIAPFVKAIQGGGTPSVEWAEAIAGSINSLQGVPKEGPLYSRLAGALMRGLEPGKAVQTCTAAIEKARAELSQSKEGALDKKKGALANALQLLKSDGFQKGLAEGGSKEIEKSLSSAGSCYIGMSNPYFTHLTIHWDEGVISLSLHPDLQGQLAPAVGQLLIDEVAKVARLTGEAISYEKGEYQIALHQKPDTAGLLVLDSREAFKEQAAQTIAYVKHLWHPTHPDLAEISIVDFANYQTLSAEKKALCLVVYAPALFEGAPATFQKDSLYCLAKGMQRVAKQYEAFPDSEMAKLFHKDMQALQRILHQAEFAAYMAPAEELLEGLATDIVFEQRGSLKPLLAATRETFLVRGAQKQPFLELSTQEERIIAENGVETAIHQDLLKWQDAYSAAQVRLDANAKYEVPKPTKSALWNNIKLQARKIFRGDEKKVIRWGLDLSGGKTVQIELRDANDQPVVTDFDIKRGINELYERINKKGVSEISIRQVGHQIVLDFPGSQALSGAELLRASTMFFHVVNETFSHPTSPLFKTTQRFLQEVWNEAQVTGKTEEKQIQEIAWNHLYGEKSSLYSESARTLVEQGLRLASPNDAVKTSSLDQTLSRIALYRGQDPSEWGGAPHPLLIVFNNYALEGSHLEQIHASYDPSKGNFLSFNIQKSVVGRDGAEKKPSRELHAWTSQFSKSSVSGTPQEQVSRGQGWRMAVVLNGSVISCPTLNEPLQDNAMISGSFSQREVGELAADLQAGSLTFTPHILSEKNVSPELGKTDRAKGIAATVVALLLVIGSMALYYRFAGLIAAAAVLFNILIMWAALQHIGAALTLAGIAGLILTVGMAVDANVLVFERIKEEFSRTGNIRSAIAAGYKKAFSAIVDSNITTIIAAVILLQFDAGPIKAFAITLIIGIASSMFTALFMTRWYFAKWIQNPKNTSLSMADWIKGSNFNFLKWAKPVLLVASLIAIVGIGLSAYQKKTLLGMDFTGGFAINLELAADQEGSYARRTKEALLARGLSAQDIQVRELNPETHLRLLLSTHLEDAGEAFAAMPLESDAANIQYPYQKNPRIQWVVETLEKEGLKLSPASLAQLHTEWTTMSGQMSDSMRNQAIFGLAIAFAAIFLYIMFRFEYKFAVAAIVCLLHDVFITLSIMSLFHFFGMPLQIDLHTVAALMTIIGYSLNDTIIIFDRIREDIHLSPNKPLAPLVNRALNATLSRTTITSGTTLLVLIALVCLGGGSIFSFSFVMLIGVIVGTLSSWFIASPLMLYFQTKEQVQEHAP